MVGVVLCLVIGVLVLDFDQSFVQTPAMKTFLLSQEVVAVLRTLKRTKAHLRTIVASWTSTQTLWKMSCNRPALPRVLLLRKT